MCYERVLESLSMFEKYNLRISVGTISVDVCPKQNL